MIDLNLLELQLTAEEGRRNDSYQDSLGLWSIGIGHHDAETREGMHWDDATVDRNFASDVAEKVHQLDQACPWFTHMNDPRQAVLIEMCFQMGLAKLLGFHNALSAMRDERFHDAAGHMLASEWAVQTPARARRMAQQMETGMWQIVA